MLCCLYDDDTALYIISSRFALLMRTFSRALPSLVCERKRTLLLPESLECIPLRHLAERVFIVTFMGSLFGECFSSVYSVGKIDAMMSIRDLFLCFGSRVWVVCDGKVGKEGGKGRRVTLRMFYLRGSIHSIRW